MHATTRRFERRIAQSSGSCRITFYNSWPNRIAQPGGERLGMESEELSSEEIALRYLDDLPWPPYPFQEQAILAWFDGEDGLLVCAPTGTGKTAIAETALYEALLTGRRAYYTTPLIALTEQKKVHEPLGKLLLLLDLGHHFLEQFLCWPHHHPFSYQ